VGEAKSPAVEHGDKKKSKVDEEDTEKEVENDSACHQGQEKECKSSGHNRPCRLRIGHQAPDFEVEGVANGDFASFSLSQYAGMQYNTFIFI